MRSASAGRAGAFVLVSCLGSLSCSAPSAHLPKAIERPQDWYAKLVDDHTDSQLRVRPNDLTSDSFAGPLAARAHDEASRQVESPAAAAYLKAVEDSDVLVIAVRKMKPDADAVVVAGGVPTSSTPSSMVDKAQRPFWKRSDTQIVGVEEWQPVSGDEEERGERLAVLPGNTWVLATAPAVDRMNAAFTSAAPAAYAPESPGGGKALFEMTIVGDALATMKKDAPPRMGPLVGALERATLRLDGGQTPGAHVVLTYADGSSARQADAMLTLLSSRAPQLRLVGDLQIAHSGSATSVDLPISSVVRDLVLSRVSSDDSSALGDRSRRDAKLKKRAP